MCEKLAQNLVPSSRPSTPSLLQFQVMLQSAAKRLRLHSGKQAVLHLPAWKPDWWVAEEESACQQVYLVTLAAVLKSPGPDSENSPRDVDALSREDVLSALLDAVAHPVYETSRQRGGRPRTRTAELEKAVVFLEQHCTGRKHFHIAVKFQFRVPFLPFKLAMRNRARLASHWSASHTMFWSACRYGVCVTPQKPSVDTKPLQHTMDGQALNLFEESQQPFLAAAWSARREQRALQPNTNGEERFTKLDFNALIIDRSLDTPAAVIAYVQEKGSDTMKSYVARVQRRLLEHIKEAHEWRDAKSSAAAERETDWQLLQRLSEDVCECEQGWCHWWRAANYFFRANAASLDEEFFAACICKIIREGPRKTTRVPLLIGPTNTMKSTIFNPVDEVFGHSHVVHKPSLKASMPLANLAKKTKRCVYWDDYRPVEYAAAGTVPACTFLSLFGGGHLEVTVSQSFHDGNLDVQWTRGALMTAKEEGLWDVMKGVELEDIRHMQSRVQQFRAGFQLSRADFQDVPNCKESFAWWAVSRSSSFACRRYHEPLWWSADSWQADGQEGSEHGRSSSWQQQPWVSGNW